MLREKDSKAYVHCQAGMNRSPNILWLYFIACGMELNAAVQMIMTASPYAAPARSPFCDDDLVRLVVGHGRAQFMPLTRPEILRPW